MPRLQSVKDTLVSAWHHVMPGDTNPLGSLHGGRLIYWMLSAASVSCMRFSRGGVVLGAVDEIHFLKPVGLWNLIEVRAFIGYSGRSSMDVCVLARSQNLRSGETSIIAVADMAFVAVDSEGRPRNTPHTIKPTEEEYEIYELAEERHSRRREKLKSGDERSMDISPYAPQARFRMLSSHMVVPADTTHGVLMFGGRLLHIIDGMAAGLASRYCAGVVVTGSVDSMIFNYPVRVGMLIDIELALNYVGDTSAEAGAKVIVENPFSGVRRHATTAYFTMIHIGEDGEPAKMPPYEPTTNDEKRIYSEARTRYLMRREKIRVAMEQAALYEKL
ncbi:MAG: acyl-CoA thioesterase [Nitrososphaerota archaeon]